MSSGVEAYQEFFEKDLIPPSWKDRVWCKEDFRRFHLSTTADKKSLEEWWSKWANEIFWFRK